MTTKTGICLQEISKVYRRNDSRVFGVDKINLEINKGEIISFLGPNGAGKTTLIQILCGFIKPDSGFITINGTYFKNSNPKTILNTRKKIGYVSELPGFYNKITGWEYLVFIGKLYGINNQELIHRIAYYSEYFELTEHYNQFIFNSSLGTQKKIAIIAALLNNPAILILDEPTNSLDPMIITKLKDLLMEFRKENKTIIIATHLLDFAEIISDRVAIINNGKLHSVIERFSFASGKEQGSRTILEEYYLNEIK
jgi:ABC-2 type transport system ATP-binding protein